MKYFYLGNKTAIYHEIYFFMDEILGKLSLENIPQD